MTMIKNSVHDKTGRDDHADHLIILKSVDEPAPSKMMVTSDESESTI